MFQIEVFYCTLTETFAIGFQKLFDHERIDFGFFVLTWLLSLISRLYGLKSARDAQLLFYFDDINFFSIFRLKGILVCSLKKFLIFSHRIL